MSNSIQSKVQILFEEKLPSLTTAIDQQIQSHGMDPLGHLLSGSRVIGSIRLTLCRASVKANVSISNTTGLSHLKLTSLQAETFQPDNQGKTQFYGQFTGQATVQSIQSRIGGRLSASCGFEHPSSNIQGAIQSSGQLTIYGGLTVKMNRNNINVTQVSIQSVHLQFNNTNVNVGSSGGFSQVEASLQNYLLNEYNSLGENILGGMLSNVVYSAMSFS